MAQKSNIQWTDATWNIAVGCTKVDEDCKFCYMYRQSLDSTRYNPMKVKKTKTVFKMPLKYNQTKSEVWPGPPLIFTSSLTDFFHEAIDEFRNEAWEIIKSRPDLIFQILTKRPERIKDCLPAGYNPDDYSHVWFGTSAGSTGIKAQERITCLLELKRTGIIKTAFLSLEPLYQQMWFINDIILQVNNNAKPLIDWVIVGGESGNDKGAYRYRPCSVNWISEIVIACIGSSVPVFVKQMGTHIAKEMKMSDRHGSDINEFPEHLRLRQFPLSKIKI